MQRPGIDAGPLLPVPTSLVKFDLALIEQPLTLFVSGSDELLSNASLSGLSRAATST